MNYSRQVINIRETPGILADNFALFPATAAEGTIGMAKDTLRVYRFQSGAWALYSGGGGGTPNWDQVLAQGGSFTANRVYDISIFRFALQDAAGPAKFLEVATPGDVAIGDLSGVANGTTFQVDETNSLIKLKAGSANTAEVSTAPLTADRQYAFPNASGTILVGNKGVSVQSGDGVTTQFTIAHGLPAAPTSVSVDPGSQAAAALSWILSISATVITIRFAAPPAAAANNLTFYWTAIA